MEKLKQQIRKIQIAEKPLTIVDYVIFCILGGLCFITFQQHDLLETAGSSFAYLNGHILDFYDYNAAGGVVDSYMASTYIIFAIWNIPLRLLGLGTVPTMEFGFKAIMWFKLCPTLFYMACGYLTYKIAMEMGMESKKSKLCAYAFLTAPVGFFSQFIFGQYDSFTLFFILLGIYYWLKNKDYKFVLFFGIGITFKYFALLIFLPLLLLKEKDIKKIIKQLVLVAIPYVAETLLYSGQSTYHNVTEFDKTQYVFAVGFDTGFFKISLVVLVFGFVCAWAYFTKTDTKDDLIRWMLYLCCIVIFAIFGLSMFHPQWLLLGVPFWVLSASIHKDAKIFFILDIYLKLFMCIFTVNQWTNWVDQYLFTYGYFGRFVVGRLGAYLNMSNLYKITDKNLVMSLFSAITLVMAVFKHPKYLVKDMKESIDHTIWWLRARFVLGVSIFVVPAVICYIDALKH